MDRENAALSRVSRVKKSDVAGLIKYVLRDIISMWSIDEYPGDGHDNGAGENGQNKRAIRGSP